MVTVCPFSLQGRDSGELISIACNTSDSSPSVSGAGYQLGSAAENKRSPGSLGYLGCQVSVGHQVVMWDWREISALLEQWMKIIQRCVQNTVNDTISHIRHWKSTLDGLVC